jgi:CRISPR-associated protein Cas1
LEHGRIDQHEQLSFVYDIADLYKVDLTLPIAFQTAAEGPKNLEREVRLRCRDVFREKRLVARIVPDIQGLLGEDVRLQEVSVAADEDPALPGAWWGPAEGSEHTAQGEGGS